MPLLALLLSALLSLAPFPVMRGGPVSGPAAPSDLTIRLDAPSAARSAVNPRIYGARDRHRPLVVIDPGHGGVDPGAISPIDGGREKDVTLALARAIRDELVASGRVRVALTREDDRYLVLPERFEIARRLGAGLFVSIHADAAPANDAARGASIYTLSEVASGREAAALAQRENQSGTIGGVALAGGDAGVNLILIDLAQRESMDISADFARLLHREAAPFFAFRPDYHQFASLIVLKAPDVPSVLFESGYLTNPADAAYIRSVEGRKQIALGMRRAIETHFARRLTDAARR